MAQIDRMLHLMKAAGASDLHLKAGMRPRYRVNGELRDVEGSAVYTREEVDKMTRELLSEEQDRVYREKGNRLRLRRCEVRPLPLQFFMEHRGPVAVFRRIPVEIRPRMTAAAAALETLIHLRGGIVLVTGPTGSGKTSTLASLLDLINEPYRKHHHARGSDRVPASEQEIGGPPARPALRPHGLPGSARRCARTRTSSHRRDARPETIRLALTAAEVGALVFARAYERGVAVGGPHHRRSGRGKLQIRATLAVAGGRSRRSCRGASTRAGASGD